MQRMVFLATILAHDCMFPIFKVRCTKLVLSPGHIITMNSSLIFAWISYHLTYLYLLSMLDMVF